ncbi:MAG: hypothetical protein JNL73_25005, partial [Anaerolineales bacterium]|nr:hypothetical protein [Anaerolineales bacterium]
GIPYAGLQVADVDNDGRRDWVGLFGTGWDGRLDLWVLLNSASGIEAQWVAATENEPGSVPSAVAAFTPDPSVGPLTVYQWTGGAAVLQAVPLVTGSRILDRLETSHLIGPGMQQQSFAITPNAGPDGASTLTVRQNPANNWIPPWVTVGWDARAQTLVEIDRAGAAERVRLKEVERLLFEAHDPEAASAVIGALIADWWELPRMLRYGGHGPETFRPYLRYLQGLAAEETGDEAAAVAAYWTLWNDYPLHPLAYVAAQRLELRAP